MNKPDEQLVGQLHHFGPDRSDHLFALTVPLASLIVAAGLVIVEPLLAGVLTLTVASVTWYSLHLLRWSYVDVNEAGVTVHSPLRHFHARWSAVATAELGPTVLLTSTTKQRHRISQHPLIRRQVVRHRKSAIDAQRLRDVITAHLWGSRERPERQRGDFAATIKWPSGTIVTAVLIVTTMAQVIGIVASRSS